MPIRKLKPVTPSTRFMTFDAFEDITTDTPEKSLLEPLKKTGGRNNLGRVTMRHRGGGHKRLYRRIDFKRDKFGIPGVVKTIEYDPNRSARIALVVYADGEKRYIIAPDGLKVGQRVLSGPQAPPEVGNALPLRNIPLGTFVHNVELKPGKGGQLARSAGTYAQLLAKEGKYATLKLPSGEMRLVPLDCMATIGAVSNPDHMNITLGKAGRSRWLGRRPHVRGRSPARGRKGEIQGRWGMASSPFSVGTAGQGL